MPTLTALYVANADSQIRRRIIQFNSLTRITHSHRDIVLYDVIRVTFSRRYFSFDLKCSMLLLFLVRRLDYWSKVPLKLASIKLHDSNIILCIFDITTLIYRTHLLVINKYDVITLITQVSCHQSVGWIYRQYRCYCLTR